METPEQIARAAEGILERTLDARPTLRPERVWDGAKSTVIRCRIERAPSALPASVIVKRSKDDEILDEWAATRFLVDIPHDPPLAPRCYGGDVAARTVVLEDLGDGDAPTTLELLMADDPHAATHGLIEHIGVTGELHAATLGRADAYVRLRAALGPRRAPDPLYEHPWSEARGRAIPDAEVRRAADKYQSSLASVGLTLPAREAAAVAEEIARAAARVEAEPGPFLAVCQGDINLPASAIRRGGRLRLYDFDSCGVRHALVEGLAGPLIWGCQLRIPAGVLRAMDAAYRDALAASCPPARDDRLYTLAAAEAAARWHVLHVVHRLPAALEGDYLRGLTTLRQQVVLWMDAFAEVAESCGHMMALGRTARALGPRLRVWWPGLAEPPYYPAFRRGDSGG